jgi:hypothetical protein
MIATLMSRAVGALAHLVIIVMVIGIMPTLLIWPLLSEAKRGWLFEALTLISSWSTGIVSVASLTETKRPSVSREPRAAG